MKLKYSEKDLAALIGEVETEFSKHLQVEEEKLEKSEKNVETKVDETLEKSEDKEFDYDEEDMATMNSLYEDMSKSEKEVHFASVKKALFGDQETEEVAKSEKTEDTIAKAEFDSVTKENAELKTDNDTLKKNIEGLTAALNKFLQARVPKQKAVTEIQYIKKSENANEDVKNLSRDEVTKVLNTKIRGGEITKAEDKEAINAYYLDNKTIDTIKHLL